MTSAVRQAKYDSIRVLAEVVRTRSMSSDSLEIVKYLRSSGSKVSYQRGFWGISGPVIRRLNVNIAPYREDTVMNRLYKTVLSFGLFAFLAVANLAAAQTQAPPPSAKEPAKSAAQAATKAPTQAPVKAPAAKPAPLEVPQLKFEKYKLDNGLEVILSEDHRLPMVAINLWYHVGPANELPGRTGFAHLFEHMMFEGSRHVPGSSHFHFLEAAGASDINGTTDFDRTNYFETLPSNQLELALWLESDRMGYLPDKLDQANLSNQQDVVRNERRQSVENQPYGLVEEELFHQLVPKGHPYYASIMGSHEDIQATKLDDVKDFFRRYYAPNNASIAIVGDIDGARTKALVEKYFGSIPRGSAVTPVDVKTPPIASERRAVVSDKVELPRVYQAWITPPIFQAGDAEADLTARILGGSKASRLYRSLVFDKKIAQTVTANQQSLQLGSVFQISATAKPGHTAEELEKAIDAELATFAAGGPTPEEVAAAQNALYSATVLSLENLGSMYGIANRLNTYNHFLKDPGYLNHDLAR